MTTNGVHEENLRLMERGADARMLSGALKKRMADREQSVVKNMISDFRAGKLTHQMSLTYAAQLSELRSLVSELERDDKLGRQAAEKELSHG